LAPAHPGVYPLSLHDALPISRDPRRNFGAEAAGERVLVEHEHATGALDRLGHELLIPRRDGAEIDDLDLRARGIDLPGGEVRERSEEHTSELQSLAYLVCRIT